MSYPCDNCKKLIPDGVTTTTSEGGEICSACVENFFPVPVWNGWGTFVYYSDVPEGYVGVERNGVVYYYDPEGSVPTF